MSLLNIPLPVPLWRLSRRWKELAEARAAELLEELLAPAEQEQLERLGYLEVPSRACDGRGYRIPRRPGMVRIFDGPEYRGSLCINPAQWVPPSDRILMHKMMLEADEAGYLRIAHFFPPLTSGWDPGWAGGGRREYLAAAHQRGRGRERPDCHGP